MKKVISVRFKENGKSYYFDPAGADIKTGEYVIVETARGVECGEVVQGVREIADAAVPKALKPITRMADSVDIRRMRQNREDEKRAYRTCQECIARHGLEMKLVEAEYTLDRSKIMFYFTADGRVDFRELVKDLAGIFHTRIYVYTQIGETEDAVTGKGWIFTKGPADKNGWPGEEMVADDTNTGWYYKDFTQNAQSVSNTNGSEGKRTITPGETLIMFSNNTYLDQGYSLHRCPHHLEPGIPLFDYEDREGWIVYDPTSDPIWRVHDDMPEIENIEFKVYTQFALFGWYKVYGIASGENQFTIWDTKDKKSWKCEKVGKDWYKTTIKLKAVKGEHEKNILLKKEDNDKSPTITLFDGNSYEKYGDTGYYQGDKWHQGTPDGVNE